MSIIDRYYKYIRPFRFLYGGVKDARTNAKCSARAEEWKAKGFKGAKLDICGGRNPYKPGEYLNVDAVDFPQVDLVFDITKTFPIEDNVIEEILSAATLEHLRKEHNLHAMREFFRVLAPGGRVRICTPDIEAIAKGILDNEDLDYVNQHLFGKYKSDDTEDLDLHKCMFPAGKLIEELEKIGFERGTRVPLDIGLHDPKYNFLVEAYKPKM